MITSYFFNKLKPKYINLNMKNSKHENIIFIYINTFKIIDELYEFYNIDKKNSFNKILIDEHKIKNFNVKEFNSVNNFIEWIYDEPNKNLKYIFINDFYNISWCYRIMKSNNYKCYVIKR